MLTRTTPLPSGGRGPGSAVPRRAANASVLTIGLLCVALGVLQVVAWLARANTILLWPVDSPAVVFNAALAFTATGVAFCALAKHRNRVAGMVGAFDVALGLVVIAEYVLDRSLGIDELLVTAYVSQPGAAPGRIPMNAAVCFVLIGGGLLVAATSRVRHRDRVFAGVGSLVGGIVVLALVGEATATRWAYSWMHVNSMALQGAVGMMLPAAAFLLMAMQHSKGAPAWLALPAGAVPLVMAGALWVAFTSRLDGGREINGAEATRAQVALGLLMACGVGAVTWLALRAERGRRLAEGESARRAAAEEESRRRAAQLENLNRELNRSNADLEQFAYAASHDLREPLRAISLPLAFIAEHYRGQLDERADEFIGFAIDGSRRMQDMIEALLRFSRVGRIEREIAPTDSRHTVEEAIAALAPLVERCGAQIDVEQLPVVLAEPEQLAQVFQNLIGNAVTFVGPGVVPRVHVRAERVPTGWRFTVTDNGIGIPAQQRERAFTMFKRLQANGEYPGTGIGLALVKKIVERHGGEVGVDDAPTGTGCQFWFTMPAVQDGTSARPGRVPVMAASRIAARRVEPAVESVSVLVSAGRGADGRLS